ncbi:MAG: hypothetical protein WDO16_21265 [Bacteroidota bacterium]
MILETAVALPAFNRIFISPFPVLQNEGEVTSILLTNAVVASVNVTIVSSAHPPASST